MRVSSTDRIVQNKLVKTSFINFSTCVFSVILTIFITSIFNSNRRLAISLLVVGITVVTALFVYGILRASRIRYIAFVSAGTKGITFYDRYFELLVKEAAIQSRHSKYKYVIFPWIAESGKAKQQVDSLKKINHSAIILIPDPEIDFEEDLKGHRNRPVILADALPENVSSLGEGIESIGGDENLGGQLASQAAIKHLMKTYFSEGTKNSERPLVWILVGREFPFMKNQRHEIFEKEIRKQYPAAIIYKSEQLEFSREKARRHTYDAISSIRRSSRLNNTQINNTQINNKQTKLPDIIFCANDDMALGCREALRQLGEEKVDTKLNNSEEFPQIIGYDGIEEAKSILRKNDEKYLLATVDVGIEKIAKNTWQLLMGHLEGVKKTVNHEPILINKNWAVPQTIFIEE